MKKFSPPQMKEVSFPTPHTPHPTPYTPLPHFPTSPLPHTPHPTPHTLFQLRRL
ncbi:unknown protein [Microcystis aeruginosa NIES-843]|uniref:Uncharacterized protein n=1 Tax=Microcystis aeruginosa (strain NIES-843 / IAM M-2473) TaxID=449447 RepID=B0JTE6_MICAN|nr:unknown protein [Microcystis aeruginosa NIES-843]